MKFIVCGLSTSLLLATSASAQVVSSSLSGSASTDGETEAEGEAATETEEEVEEPSGSESESASEEGEGGEAASSFGPPATPPTSGEDFVAPNGQLGAGLSMSPDEKFRFYADGGLHFGTRTEEFPGDDVRITRYALPLIIGGGYKLMPNLELEGRFAIAAANIRYKVPGCNDPDCRDSFGSFTPGNLYAGVNYLIESGQWLAKVGGGVAFGPWTFDASTERNVAYYYSAITSLEDFYMFAPEILTVVAPARVEYRFMPELAFTGDATLALYIPVGGNGDPELSAMLAPGAAYLYEAWTFGGRLPLFWMMTEDTAQFAIEPYARFDFDRWWVSGRFTLNLDRPYGFSFDEGRYWALHAAVGATF